MSKPIDSLHLSELPTDRCRYCFLTMMNPHWFTCRHPDNRNGCNEVESCTMEDWERCPCTKDGVTKAKIVEAAACNKRMPSLHDKDGDLVRWQKEMEREIELLKRKMRVLLGADDEEWAE